jgi:DNA-binding transcriptional LysR family regulator
MFENAMSGKTFQRTCCMLHDSTVMFRQLAHLSGLSLERLASLCEVAEAGSIGQASRGDANRQSLLSRQIAELEAVFGVALLARQSRPFRLTEQGKELAQAARLFFQTVEDLQKRVGKEAQRVVVGAGEALIQWLLFPVCEAVKEEVGDVVFSFKNLDSVRLVEGLQRGEIDLALIRAGEVTPSLARAGNWRYAYAPFVPKTLSRSTRELTVADLGRLPWALLEGRGHFRQFLEEAVRQQGSEVHCAMECSSYTQVAMAIQTGRYAGFLPEFSAGSSFGNKAAVSQRAVVKALRYERTLTLAWRESTLRARPVLEKVIQEAKGELSARLDT